MCQSTIRTSGLCGCGCCCCCCCGGVGFNRRFFTVAEEKERLESYRDALKKELAGVEERLKEFE